MNELQAETSWFHVFKTMIESGDVANIGPYAFTVYCIIKAHTNFKTGESFPSVELIAEKSGVSVAQVKRELKTLESAGYITKEKRGRFNRYTLREKVEIQDDQGRPAAIATWDYLPSGVKEAMAELKNVLMTGDFGSAKIVQIEKIELQVNINHVSDGGVVINAHKSPIGDETLATLKAHLK